MANFVRQTIDILNVYEGRDAAITLTLYFCCLLSGFYPLKSRMHRSLQRISKRFEDCRVVLRLFDDLTILRDFFTYELRAGERNFFVRVLKSIHYLAWLAYYPSEHICWLGEMKLIDIQKDFWQFNTAFTWSVALGTSACWNAYVVFQYLTAPNVNSKKKKDDDASDDEDEEVKPLIPWIAARNAALATIRDGTEFVVAVHYLPHGYLWSSTLTFIQVGTFGTCSALIRLFVLFKYQHFSS